MELFLYQLPDVYHSYKKRRNHSLHIFNPRYRQAPCSQISKNSPRPTESMNFRLLILVNLKIGGFQIERIRAKSSNTLYRMESLSHCLLFYLTLICISPHCYKSNYLFQGIKQHSPGFCHRNSCRFCFNPFALRALPLYRRTVQGERIKCVALNGLFIFSVLCGYSPLPPCRVP